MNLRLHSHEFLFPANFLWISDCIPMSSYSQPTSCESQTAFPWVPIHPVNESQTAFPWVPIHPAYESQTAFHEFLSPLSVPMNLRLHSMSSYPPPVSSCESQNASHEFLFPANESRTAFPWVPIPLPMDLKTAFHEFLFPPVSSCESQTAFPWVPVRCLWIQDSDCIPWVPIPSQLPVNLRLHSREFLFHCQIFGVFWLGTTHVLPSCFKRSHRDPKKLHSGAILGVPLYIPHGYP